MKKVFQFTNKAFVEIREGIADFSSIICDTFKSPDHLRALLNRWERQRRDGEIKTRLDRQIRRQFIQAFNLSATKKLSVEINEEMEKYQQRNGLFSLTLRPYEELMNLNVFLRFPAIIGVFQAARYLAYPLIGAWSVALPLAGLIGMRVALLCKEGQNSRQEKRLESLGLLVPCRFDVEGGAVAVGGKVLRHNLPIAFPIVNQSSPEWLLSFYDSNECRLSRAFSVHASALEALRLNRLTRDQFNTAIKSFPDQCGRNLFFACCVFFTGLDVKEISSFVSQITQEKGAAEKILRMLEPFCIASDKDDGLSVLAGRLNMQDLRYLESLSGLGNSLSGEQAKDIKRMLSDSRFSSSLGFRDMVEISLWPRERSSSFEELWKDNSYREKFGFDALKETLENMNSWGGVALRLARHDYTKSLTGRQIIELSLPENEHWAKAYHLLAIESPESVESIGHEQMRQAVQKQGLLAFKDKLQRHATEKNKRVLALPPRVQVFGAG